MWAAGGGVRTVHGPTRLLPGKPTNSPKLKFRILQWPPANNVPARPSCGSKPSRILPEGVEDAQGPDRIMRDREQRYRNSSASFAGYGPGPEPSLTTEHSRRTPEYVWVYGLAITLSSTAGVVVDMNACPEKCAERTLMHGNASCVWAFVEQASAMQEGRYRKPPVPLTPRLA
ncbi:hypothetical protein EW146_g6980 [Bondarzewia mesenterica]|uniref:Uncharacterized protein n=1 Tax=Bondarzewia mesenterica TaxID=1095465 RepID=A0A4S4LSR3_9AGAM|nr:hypothetical protein EW146_g6980 [Bondarzewia mesenterica]